ncbi:MAG: peptidoglycan-binding domain-containing protein [Minisyncoccia bacterium]
MKNSIYSFLLAIFLIFVLGYFLEPKAVMAECPIQTLGLSRKAYNDLKNDPAIVNEVKALQTIFSKIPNIGWKTNYKISGVFGYGTEGLLRRFQKVYGLTNNGIIDEATRNKLCEIWEYQNRTIKPQGISGGAGTDGTQTSSTYTPQGGGGSTSLGGGAKQCVYKVWSKDPAYCGSKPYCCVKYFTYVYGNQNCPADMCQSDNDYTGNYLNDSDFWDEYNKGILNTSQSKFKVCEPKKCTERGCVPSFVGYVKKPQNCPTDECLDDKQCSSDYKKCVFDDCILVIPSEQKYECATVTKYVKKTENCPASTNCKLYGCINYGTVKHTCIVKKCENKNTPEGKCKEEKVSTYEPCDSLKNECSNDNDCKLVEKYKFDLNKCECIKDQTNGTLTLSDCELEKAKAIQKQEGGCKGKQPSDDWLKTVDCSLGNYTGSQPEFECEQKLGCKWCPECVQPSAVSGDFGDRGNAQTAHSMYTGYPGGKCIKINEPCVGKIVKGKCGAECDESFEVVNPISCTTGSYWGNDWARQNCDDPKTCEARCYYGNCQYTDKGFRENCEEAKTQEECSKIPSCTWVYECRGQQLDGPYRPTWYYTGPLKINTCTAWGIYMTDWDYKCVKGKCGAECDDDSDCPAGSRCSLYCKCTASDSDCIGDSDLGNPFTYGECRNGPIKKPSDYIWKDRCDGPKILIEATLVDKGNCQCGYQTIDCSKLLVNGICKDGKCVSSTEGEKTYCGCKDFQKICATEKDGGGNIGEKIECRPGSEASCPDCSKSCWWYKCEKNQQGEYRCKQYYEEKVSKEKPCPQSDASCSDGVINKVCTPPTETKCSSYGTDFSCYSRSDCEETLIKAGVKECEDQNKVCCKKKTTSPTQYTKCQIISYSIGGVYNYTWTCVATTDSTKNDNCEGLSGQELVNFCTQKYGPPGPTSTECKDNKQKIAVDQTYCDYSNCPTTAFGFKTILAYLRQIFLAASTPPVNVNNGVCKKVQTVWVCPEDKDRVSHECDNNLDCPCPSIPPAAPTEKCSDYKSLGYECVMGSSGESCEPGTNKGQLDCGAHYVCCKMKTSSEKCSDYAGYSCQFSSDCESGTSRGTLDCTGGKVCCIKKSTTGQWCERCSTLKPCTYVRWYDRSGGCDDDFYNERQEFIKDSCGGCGTGYTCQNGACVSASQPKNCGRCSNTYPCKSAYWIIPASDVEKGVTCADDPVKKGYSVNYTTDDSCTSLCSSGKCQNGACVSN